MYSAPNLGTMEIIVLNYSPLVHHFLTVPDKFIIYIKNISLHNKIMNLQLQFFDKYSNIFSEKLLLYLYCYCIFSFRNSMNTRKYYGKIEGFRPVLKGQMNTS